MPLSTIMIRFDPERPIGERWLILETNEHGLVVVRASFRSQVEAERALTTLVPLGKKEPQGSPGRKLPARSSRNEG